MLAMLCDPNWGFRYLRWYLDSTISSSDGRAAVVKAMRGMYTYCRVGALPKLRASHRTRDATEKLQYPCVTENEECGVTCCLQIRSKRKWLRIVVAPVTTRLKIMKRPHLQEGVAYLPTS